MATGGELQTHEAVVGLDQSGEGREVGGGAGVRLNVDTPDDGIQAEGLESPLTADVLNLIDVLVTAVVPGAR
ncbi:hypothetical protein BC936DRAFT_141174 [Jimgerdemannia flammicorona]|uniref:Uncharacterized protein n=2 Tax=Jimgerdemannia flammicorona TaxID=994334 RepID=A0A433DGB5_9FUNG|nr:hypothetical protein BC936DRAFT_141174 [Jimgerdemannia flammicorona]RUS34732.1 hypothetical protein BC938DRAFT_478853 [Jimgerdemannia flammicorona]